MAKDNRHLIDKAINENLRDALAPYIAKEVNHFSTEQEIRWAGAK